MDRKKCAVLRDKLQAVLDANPQPGHRVRLTTGRFDDTSVTFKLEVAEISEDGLVMDAAANEFRMMAALCGLLADDLGKEVTLNSERYKITGAKWRTRFPIIVLRLSDRKTFRFAVSAVQRALGRPVTP